MGKTIDPNPEKVRSLYDEITAILMNGNINEAEALTLANWMATFVILELWLKRGFDPHQLAKELADGIRLNINKKVKEDSKNTVH